MPGHVLKLLFLLTAFAVAPATAGNPSGATAGKHYDEAGCPFERARLANVWMQSHAQTPKAPTRITLLGGTRSERAAQPGVVRGGYFNP